MGPHPTMDPRGALAHHHLWQHFLINTDNFWSFRQDIWLLVAWQPWAGPLGVWPALYTTLYLLLGPVSYPPVMLVMVPPNLQELMEVDVNQE